MAEHIIDKFTFNGDTYILQDNESGYITIETDPTVPSWAKAASKPSYTASQVGAAASSHAHGNITSGGDITTSSTIASGDRLVINDQSASKVTNSSITFGSNSNQYLANDGTWQTVPSGGGGSTYTEGPGIDITNDVISVQSNLSVVGDTAYLEYLTPSLQGAFVIDNYSFMNGGDYAYTAGEYKNLTFALTDYSDFIPIIITNYQLTTTNGNIICQNMYIAYDNIQDIYTANFFVLPSDFAYSNPPDLSRISFDVIYINSGLILQQP